MSRSREWRMVSCPRRPSRSTTLRAASRAGHSMVTASRTATALGPSRARLMPTLNKASSYSSCPVHNKYIVTPSIAHIASYKHPQIYSNGPSLFAPHIHSRSIMPPVYKQKHSLLPFTTFAKGTRGGEQDATLKFFPFRVRQCL